MSTKYSFNKEFLGNKKQLFCQHYIVYIFFKTLITENFQFKVIIIRYYWIYVYQLGVNVLMNNSEYTFQRINHTYPTHNWIITQVEIVHRWITYGGFHVMYNPLDWQNQIYSDSRSLHLFLAFWHCIQFWNHVDLTSIMAQFPFAMMPHKVFPGY